MTLTNGGNGTDTGNLVIKITICGIYQLQLDMTTGDGNDLLISIENANAGGGNNTILGNSASNRFTGGSGNDVIGKKAMTISRGVKETILMVVMV